MPENLDEPPPEIVPVTVPGDATLLRKPGLLISAGSVKATPQGFEFTLSVAGDLDRDGVVPAESIALYPQERGQHSWLSVRYADGRQRSADLNANMPFDQPDGPHLTFIDGAGSYTDGWEHTRWRVTPLPPPGPVQITFHLGGHTEETGSGYLDGQVIAEAGTRAQ
jgi:hypothetical protein